LHATAGAIYMQQCPRRASEQVAFQEICKAHVKIAGCFYGSLLNVEIY
jgi:hypothetical protein